MPIPADIWAPRNPGFRGKTLLPTKNFCLSIKIACAEIFRSCLVLLRNRVFEIPICLCRCFNAELVVEFCSAKIKIYQGGMRCTYLIDDCFGRSLDIDFVCVGCERYRKRKGLANDCLQGLDVPGCGSRTRTCDLRVMSPTSCQLLHPATEKDDYAANRPGGQQTLPLDRTGLARLPSHRTVVRAISVFLLMILSINCLINIHMIFLSLPTDAKAVAWFRCDG